MTSKEARTAYKQVQDIKAKFLDALAERGYQYKNGKVIAAAEEDKEKAAEAVDSEDGVRYNRRRYQPQKFSFQHKNFPSETKSQSEAHRLAVWWASKSDVQTKDQTLISMNGKWYLVEKFDDSLNHYQVEDYITEREYNFIEKEIKEHGRSGYIKSIQRSTDRLDLLDQQRNSDGNEKSGVDRDETRHGSQNQQIQQMGKAESQKRETASDRNGDRESSGSYRQGDTVRFSRLPANAESLAEQHFGTTTRWKETGYLTTDGKMLDFSGLANRRKKSAKKQDGSNLMTVNGDMKHYPSEKRKILQQFTMLDKLKKMHCRQTS